MALLRIHTPCDADWNEMPGDDLVRHCARCSRDVHDLTRRSESEAALFVLLQRGSVCARLARAATVSVAVAACATPPTAAHSPAVQRLDASAPFADVDASPAAAARIVDRDGGGFPDEADACPTAPGGWSDAGRSGCPRSVSLSDTGMTVLSSNLFLFARGSKSLPTDDAGTFAELRDLFARTGARIEVRGYASTDEQDGKRLSEARARAVVARLIAAGTPKERLVARGYGATEPVGDEATDGGRAQNRRVELRGVEDAAAVECPPNPPVNH